MKFTGVLARHDGKRIQFLYLLADGFCQILRQQLNAINNLPLRQYNTLALKKGFRRFAGRTADCVFMLSRPPSPGSLALTASRRAGDRANCSVIP